MQTRLANFGSILSRKVEFQKSFTFQAPLKIHDIFGWYVLKLNLIMKYCISNENYVKKNLCYFVKLEVYLVTLILLHSNITLQISLNSIFASRSFIAHFFAAPCKSCNTNGKVSWLWGVNWQKMTYCSKKFATNHPSFSNDNCLEKL